LLYTAPTSIWFCYLLCLRPVGKVAHHTGNNAQQFQGQRSRSPGRLMLRPEVHHIFRKGRPIRTSNLVHRRSTMTSISDKRYDLQGQRSRSQGHVTPDASDRCWRISRERSALETPKLVGRYCPPHARAIMRTSFKVNFGVSGTFRSRLIGQHLSDASRNFATLTFDLGGHVACR